MNLLTIVDGNNFFRRRIESITAGSPTRSCFYELHNRPGTIIAIWDGAGGLKRRRELYPEYKLSRKPAGESIYAAQDLFKKLLTFSKVLQIEVKGFEGDDVIAAICKQFGPRFDNVFIESNDLDLYQLGRNMSRDKFPDTPENIRIYKTLVGDPSDNIPGCKGFGKVTWTGLTEPQKRVLEALVMKPETSEEIAKELTKDFLPPRVFNQFIQVETRRQLNILYQIVGFLEVPFEAISSGMTEGLNRPDLAETLFKEYML